MTPAEIAALAAKLTKAQREFLLRYDPVLTDQPVAAFLDVCPCAFFVQMTPDEYDEEHGFLLFTGEVKSFASGHACSPEGSVEFEDCTIRYNETGLALRAYLQDQANE